MDLLKHNLSLLKKYDVELYTRVVDKLGDKVDNQFSVVSSKSGRPTLIYNVDKPRYLLSSYNPVKEADRWVGQQKDCRGYIVFGFGLGHHLQKLLEGSKSVLVIEPSMDILCLAMANVNLEWLFQEESPVELVAGYGNRELSISIRKFINENEDFDYVALPGYINNFNRQYLKVQKVINEQVSSKLVNINTFNIFGKAWTNNFFENLPIAFNSTGVKNLFNQFKGIPAVIISAGPSLNKNIKLLHKLKDRAILIAVGTVYKALKAEDIKPHFIVSFDGGLPNYLHFKNVKIEDVPLIFDPVIYPDIVREYQGKLITANISNVFMNWFEEKLNFTTGLLAVGPSVANVSLDLACKLGAEPIIFVGQDLAYTGGKTHARGTIYEKNRVEAKNRLNEIYLEDIHGNKVLSSRSFLTFLRWFESYIEVKKDRLFIDATEGGARIKGTKVMNLQEVIDVYCRETYQVKDMIDIIITSSPKLKDEIDGKVTELLEDIILDLKKMNKKAARGLELVQQLAKGFENHFPGPKWIDKIIRKLDRIDKEVKELKESKVFIQIIFQPLIRPLLYGPDARAKEGETEREACMRIIRHNRNLYDAFYETSKQVLEMAEKAKANFLAL